MLVRSMLLFTYDWYSCSYVQRSDALAHWGHPKTVDDLTSIFLRYLNSELSTSPFSPSALSAESLLILPHLITLTKHSWWTVGSQPAVDGAPSSDEVVGWGPRNGHVFQKGFVEFFCGPDDVERLEQKIEAEGKGWVSWFAGNNEVRSVEIRL